MCFLDPTKTFGIDDYVINFVCIINQSLLSSPPPHHQLIIAVAGVLTGYNGSFEFEEPGQQYEDTPYVGMRVVRAYTVYSMCFTLSGFTSFLV